jgi:hypothetical protein
MEVLGTGAPQPVSQCDICATSGACAALILDANTFTLASIAPGESQIGP